MLGPDCSIVGAPSRRRRLAFEDDFQVREIVPIGSAHRACHHLGADVGAATGADASAQVRGRAQITPLGGTLLARKKPCSAGASA